MLEGGGAQRRSGKKGFPLPFSLAPTRLHGKGGGVRGKRRRGAPQHFFAPFDGARNARKGPF